MDDECPLIEFHLVPHWIGQEQAFRCFYSLMVERVSTFW
jgi:hypothetical protein